MQDSQQLAANVLALLDLTRLEDDPNEDPVRKLCAKARTPFGHPAAICIYPRFIPAAREALSGLGLEKTVAIATVANFPEGRCDPESAASEVEQAIILGAAEVDVVFPWRELLGGNEIAGRALVGECRSACGDHTLKVIIESGMLGSMENVRRASEIAIEAGADFIKTSTGKAEAGATPEAARTMLETIRAIGRPTGFKVSGGVRTLADAEIYLGLAESIMGPEWVTPARFRIGASGLMDALLAKLDRRSGSEQD